MRQVNLILFRVDEIYFLILHYAQGEILYKMARHAKSDRSCQYTLR